MSNQGDISQLKIAIVHDELTRRGGAEVFLEELLRLVPQADVFTLYSGQPLLIVDGRHYHVRTSFLQRFPAAAKRHPARLLPLLPHAAEQFDLSAYDLVISSSSGFAKAVITRVNIPHICYCHAPTRYLWDSTHAVTAARPGYMRGPARLLFHYLRLADYAAAQRVDFFLANSKYTQRRIQSYYRRESTVLYPPIATDFFTPAAEYPDAWPSALPRNFFLCVGRLTKSKYFDQAVRVSEKLSLPLIIVGHGPEYSRLKKLGGRNIRIINHAEPALLRTLYRSARALLQPGAEDFGMAMAESLSCGTPVITLNQGAAPEIILDLQTGILYDSSGDEALAEGIRRFLQIEPKFIKSNLQQSVLKFSRYKFKSTFTAYIQQIIESSEEEPRQQPLSSTY